MPRVVVLSFVIAAACSSAAPTTTTTSPATLLPPSPPTAPVTTAAASTTLPPPTTEPPAAFTLDDHVAWVLGLLNGGAPQEADYEARFNDGFRAVVPYDAFAAPLAGLAGEWTVVGDERAGSRATVTLEPAEGARLVATFTLDDGPDGRLGGLLLQPAALDDAPDDLDALAERWSGLAPAAQFLVADEACVPEAGAAPGELLAVGSVFKLWVLHELASAVAGGSAAWDEPLAVRDGLKSLPSGIMQDEPAGTEFTLAEHAELMIAISDNTATDHLIDRLGREAVEAAVAATGHSQPVRNRPFLTTRELFWLKLAAPEDVVADYVAGDEAARRAILDGADVDLAGAEPELMTQPVEIETLEWFASAADACRALTSLLDEFGDTPVRDVLTQNPGVRVGEGTWPQVAFKGGSEPGVLALAWHATRADGRVFVIVGILNDPDQPLDEITAVLLAETVFDLLAEL